MACAIPKSCADSGADNLCGGRMLKCRMREPVPVLKEYLVYVLDGIEVDYHE